MHVQEPMNLTWMKDKVRNEQYPSAAAYAADIELIRSNAQTYNKPGDPVYQFADKLRDTCAQELLTRGYDMGPAVVKELTAAQQAALARPQAAAAAVQHGGKRMQFTGY
jgi:Bromodomain